MRKDLRDRPRAERVRRQHGGGPDRITGVIAVVAFLALWEVVARSGLVNPQFTSSPSLIAIRFIQLLHQGVLAHSLAVSGDEFFVGYALSVLVGIPFGLGIGWYRRMSAALEPFVAAVYSTPKVALVPLFLVWFGIGIWSKVAIVFFGCVIQILINTQAGVQAVDRGLVKVARSFGATDRQVFSTIVLPNMVPFLMAGLRLAVGFGLVGVVVGELYASSSGIGYQLSRAGETFQTSLTFDYVMIMVAAGLFFSWLLGLLEKRFESWRPATRS